MDNDATGKISMVAFHPHISQRLEQLFDRPLAHSATVRETHRPMSEGCDTNEKPEGRARVCHRNRKLWSMNPAPLSAHNQIVTGSSYKNSELVESVDHQHRIIAVRCVVDDGFP
jgi:hypothetical protein